MACCVLLSLLITAALCLPRYFLSRSAAVDRAPLAWRLHGQARKAPRPARFTLSPRLRSFAYALKGLGFMVRSEPNAKIHLAATCLVIATGLAVGLEAADWRWIIVALVWVWVAEAMNTALEQLCDVVSPSPNQAIGIAKDVAAGAVLVSAIGAAILGAVSVMPYLVPPAGFEIELALCRAGT